MAIHQVTIGQHYSAYSAAAILPDFNFASAGDWGCFSSARSIVNSIIGMSTELVLGLGDYSYEDSADCWLDIISPIANQTKIVIGNHDVYPPSLLNQYMSHFGLTKQYYSFNYQNVHFIAMSVEIPYEVGSEQYNFVNNDLSQAAADPNIDWIIVYFHNPMYISSSSHSTETTLRSIYHPLFDKYGVDLVLQAHHHAYERSYPILYNRKSPSNPIISDNNSNNYNNPKGRIFATVGTGGAFLENFTGQASYMVNQYDIGWGFLHVDVINNGKILSAKFCSADGSIKDQFTITKSISTSPSSSSSSSYHYEPNLELTGSNYYDKDQFTITKSISTSPSSSSSSYHYEPNLELTGSNYYDAANNSTLKLTNKFSIATWFRTPTMDVPSGSDAYIVNKGGIGIDSEGDNMNYGIWMTGSGTIRAGFEDSSGVLYSVESPKLYRSHEWHYVVVTYDGLTLRLYIDGVQIAGKFVFGAIPDNTNTQPVRIGANSLSATGFFTGNADEVRIWNRTLTASEIDDAYNKGVFNTNGQVLYLPFETNLPLLCHTTSQTS